ncbi:hypothetical protein AX769_08005 [Frondihabitans sp. PAMC 28766]|uniref:hypothetical protein n=1 Tax=Frondihabitans sp. PAMC 28766 TaxID=1795630 RepID=UPI00078D2580|nr:hypothetical protein [Frondihabitans sp. PAMC 28766]AMM20120.1 hypothetical protein AX769_08005 [Frondihabitans sp. PAMC 28766]
MHSSAIQALIVLTDPSCVFTLDLVHDGYTSAADIAMRVSARLDIPLAQAAEVLDGLVGIDFVERVGPDEIASKGLEAFGDRCSEAADHLAWLRSVGDDENAQDIVDAIEAAWGARSLDDRRRRRAAGFRRSPAGLRHAARLRARTLGFAFADGPADAAAEGRDEARAS